ncbi:hypothetical protein COCC4DRAFT_198064 [Bipolaris maydis ATCC 48331]|uniref:Uncharacterized protein n=2 Tax=Cochliobolus heterostrophus TaxID=5016 RepID=M2TI77_COCH5|nr:uncharacterized protein COCC4DRAFT_198064 [Bipolaris maydis ATCC 48331]EMD97140.1 hypothetical protein COCHEDRAFT_1220618 [Bipolaris maydis C5]ENI04395.1 hypothetical protein COCC4DRAFT_198064 [Bipolaris maydis ATCC 48331]
MPQVETFHGSSVQVASEACEMVSRGHGWTQRKGPISPTVVDGISPAAPLQGEGRESANHHGNDE